MGHSSPGSKTRILNDIIGKFYDEATGILAAIQPSGVP